MNTMAMSTDKLLEDAVEAIGQVSVAGCPPGVGYLFDAPKVRGIVYSAIMAKLHRHGLKVQGSCSHEQKIADIMDKLIAGKLAEANVEQIAEFSRYARRKLAIAERLAEAVGIMERDHPEYCLIGIGKTVAELAEEFGGLEVSGGRTHA